MYYAILNPSRNYQNVGVIDIEAETQDSCVEAAESLGFDAADASLEIIEGVKYLVLSKNGQHIVIFARLS